MRPSARRALQVGIFVTGYGVMLVGGVYAMYTGALTPFFAYISSLGLLGNAILVLAFVPASLPFLAG